MSDQPTPTADLTPSQTRLLCFMDEWGPKWFSLLELDSVRLLETDDVVTIPSLVERGLIMHLAPMKAVALTASGTVVADEIRSEQARSRHEQS